VLNEEEFAKILIEVAHGIGKGNVELARELIEKGIRRKGFESSRGVRYIPIRFTTE